MVHTLRLDSYYPTPRKLVLGTNSSFGTESIKIERGAGWDGLNLTATWHIPGREEPLRVALLDGDAMDVPPEVTKEAKDGVLVLAGLASGVQRASCNVEYLILEQAGVYGGADAEPTPELAAQVLEATMQAKANAEAAAQDASEAKANANKAQQAAENAAADAAKAGPYAEAALAAKEAAEAASDNAQAAARAAKASENAAKASENAAAASEDNARISAGAAAVSEGNAAASKKAAAASAVSAAGSAAQAEAQKTAAEKSAADADSTANSIKDSMTQIAANKEAVSQLKEDLDTLAENDFMAILDSKLDVIKGKFEKGSIDKNGQNIYSNDLMRSIDYIKIYPGIPYKFKTINGNGLVIYVYKSDGSVRSEFMAATTTERTRTITFNSDDEKIRVVINAYNEDYTTYPVSANNFESIIANVSKYIAKDYNYGSIYHGTINIDTVNKTVNTSGASILTNYGVYIKIPAAEISIDYEVAVYIGVNKYDYNLIVKTLDSSMASDFIRIFVYHRGKVWFADKINGITIDGKNYNENVKTICCIGDSFTASNISWHTFIGQNLGYDMVNLGVSGTRMTVTYTSGGTNYECFIDRVANGALNSYSPDLIVLFGGINDTVKLHNNQMHIGTVEDEAEYSASTTSGYSFISRVKYLINLIKEKKPSAQILGVIPPNYSEGTSGYEWWAEYIAQIQEALRKVYEYYGIPYVDLKKRCQEMYESAYNLSTYRINGRSNMHPSKNGYEAIAKCIQKDGIENMFVN